MLGRCKKILVQHFLGTLTHVVTSEPIVALTFDDGPDPQTTPRLLEILRQYQAKATFFMIGRNATRFPDLVRQVAEAGHTVANHSWGHASFPYISSAERRTQIRDCAEALAPYGAKLFRPPYGNQTFRSRLAPLWMGYQVVAWNLAAHDWLDHGAQQMIDDVSGKIAPGSILLFHDGMYDTINDDYADREPMLETIERLLGRYSDEYQFVTVPDLLRRGKGYKQYWRMKADISFLNNLHCTSGDGRRYQV